MAINDSIAVGVDRVKAFECCLTNVDEAITKFINWLTGIDKYTEGLGLGGPPLRN
jgi:hypothetical protein